ncbi:MAG: biotin--[acetyl-CoA-carboxylase] ligase [Tatlockia sp.]|nr:biotin--[acetyl-CoA-carboxylase] ligase [Tatlockia sp.]
MKRFSESELKILHLLSDRTCYSIEYIALHLNLSIPEVLRLLNQLTELDLAIKHVPMKGYQLSKPIQILDEQIIRQNLELRGYRNPFNFHLFAELNSTNQFLKELPLDTVPDICCAEKQTQGRGRFGRKWISPFGENIYFSGRWNLECSLADLSGLSLVVGLATLASLKHSLSTEDIRIKWPNDILWGNKKLCGILIELGNISSNCAQVIIGIGLNVNTATQDQPKVGLPWCSLYEITDNYFDRNKIIADLIFHLRNYLASFFISGFSFFMDEWKNFDYLRGQFVQVSQSAGFLSGTACGVNEQGQLVLLDEKDITHNISSGDASLGTSLKEF